MQWKRRRLLYQKECQAYARHILEQHAKHIFDKSLLDEAPGNSLREKLAFLMHSKQDHIYAHLSHSTRYKMRSLREQTITKALQWQRKHYSTMAIAAKKEKSSAEKPR